jgi:hypothetical protein
MKRYITANLTPVLIGFVAGLLYCVTLNVVESIIIKIAIIYAK